jgi:hypothetical protein
VKHLFDLSSNRWLGDGETTHGFRFCDLSIHQSIENILVDTPLKGDGLG